MKAARLYKGIAIIGATALIIAGTNTLFELEDHKLFDKEDGKYHMSQDDHHKEPAKMKLGEETALKQRIHLKRKWEYGIN